MKILIAGGLLLTVASCTDNQQDLFDDSSSPREMRFEFAYPDGQSRATDTSFEAGDCVSLFVKESGKPLEIAGNPVNNECLTFDGSAWNFRKPFYWDQGTYDAVALYPYCGEIASISDFAFEILSDQRPSASAKGSVAPWPTSSAVAKGSVAPWPTCAEEGAVQGEVGRGRTLPLADATGVGRGANLPLADAHQPMVTDLMYASVSGVEASSEPVRMTFRHLLSKLTVRFVKGEDYEGELPKTATVLIHNTVTRATLDLNVGVVTKDPRAVAETVTARQTGASTYSAILVPQRIDNRVPLVEVLVGGVSLVYEGKFQLKPGVHHLINLIIERNPEQSNITIGGEITDWEGEGF